MGLLAGWLAVAGRLWLFGWLSDGCGWLAVWLAGWLAVAGRLWLAGWLTG